MNDQDKRLAEAQIFLNWLYFQAIHDHDLAFQVFTLPDQITKTFQDIEAAARYAIERSEHVNVYACMGMCTPDKIKRLSVEEVAAIPGFWGDKIKPDLSM